MSKRLFSLSFAIISLIIISLTLSLSGCSKPVPPQGAFEQTVKIGLILPLKGDYEKYGTLCKNGIDLAVDEINARGGIDGKNLEVIPGNDTSEPKLAASIALNYAEVQKVSAIIGPYTSQSAQMAAPISNRTGVPMLAIRASESNVTRIGKEIFRACYVDTYQGTLLGRFAGQNLKVKKAAVIYNSGDEDAKTLVNNFKREIEKYGGKVETIQSYTNNTTDFTSQVSELEKVKPDVVLLPDFEDKAGQIIKKAAAMGVKTTYLGTEFWNVEQLIKIAGQAAVGSYFSDHFSPEDPDPETQRFVDSYEGDYGIRPGPSAALSYDAVLLVVEAMKKADSTDPGKITNALASIKGFKGVSGTYTFDADRNPVKGGVILKVLADGQAFEKRIEP
ncbi:MAG: ABC transporter substrate-binding protein [Candidatus Aquicultor sp.]